MGYGEEGWQNVIRAERIFCEPWTREEVEQLREERIADGYLQQVLGMQAWLTEAAEQGWQCPNFARNRRE
ncbi:hypothetical protein MKZ24_14720 [Paenibacillus sp. FSL R7-0297]|uniref:hypothetical protein n=1 Tax=unclassified Paenibacillus TaxID=185978 RepID=UPI0004F8B3FF|nr:hypothetical protein [Paenibacillus sp. FSL R5-0912]AIQ42757.1 hypothetical protein R50912_23960 [Paenibacillus sp. FSL R5-0912]